MIAKALVKLGNISYTFEADEKDPIESLHIVVALANIRKVCNLCKATQDQFYFTTNKHSGQKGTFTFINVKCGNCDGKSALGQYKTGGYFWKDFEKYEKGKHDSEQQEE